MIVHTKLILDIHCDAEGPVDGYAVVRELASIFQESFVKHRLAHRFPNLNMTSIKTGHLGVDKMDVGVVPIPSLENKPNP